MGETNALGVIPQFARELYERIEGTTDTEVSVCVSSSYLCLITCIITICPYLILYSSISCRLVINLKSVIMKFIKREYMICWPQPNKRAEFM